MGDIGDGSSVWYGILSDISPHGETASGKTQSDQRPGEYLFDCSESHWFGGEKDMYVGSISGGLNAQNENDRDAVKMSKKYAV